MSSIIISGKISKLKFERQVVGRISRNVAKFSLDGRNITYPFLPELHEFTSRKILQYGDLVSISGENKGSDVLCFAIRDYSSGHIIAKMWQKPFFIFTVIIFFMFSIYLSTPREFIPRNMMLAPAPKIEFIFLGISFYFLIESIRYFNHKRNICITNGNKNG